MVDRPDYFSLHNNLNVNKLNYNNKLESQLSQRNLILRNVRLAELILLCAMETTQWNLYTKRQTTSEF